MAFARLDAFILAMSQHFRILKEVIGDRKGTYLFPSVEDARAADAIADMIEDIGGKGLANYCRLAFRKAYTIGNLKAYNVRKMLEYIRDNSPREDVKNDLTEKLDAIVELVDRLSRPIVDRSPVRRRRKKKDSGQKVEQLLLFPDLEEEGKNEKAKEGGDKTKKQRKPRKRNPGNHKGRPRARRTSKMDKLADEILEAEYGPGGKPPERDDEDDFEEKRSIDDDVCDYYSKGYSRMRRDDYDYYSGDCDNY